MFDSFNFNTTNYNVLALAPDAEASSSLIFNGYDLQSTDVITSILIQDNAPDRAFDTSPIPRGDGEIIVGDYWRRKVVKVKGIIKKGTAALLDAEIDAMKKALRVPEGILDIKVPHNDGTVRRYQATLTNGNSMFDERQSYHVTFCPFTAEFTTVEPFGHSVLYDSASFLGTTDLVFDEQVDNLGTVRAKPVIILNVISASSVVAISFKNNTTGEEIKLTNSVVAGDYVKFDSEEMQVTINGTVYDFTGAFPTLETGANSITITVTGSACTYDLTIKHKTPYL